MYPWGETHPTQTAALARKHEGWGIGSRARRWLGIHTALAARLSERRWKNTEITSNLCWGELLCSFWSGIATRPAETTVTQGFPQKNHLFPILLDLRHAPGYSIALVDMGPRAHRWPVEC